MKLEGCRAVVTGGAAGIGFELTKALLRARCAGVAICDVNRGRLDEAQRALSGGEGGDRVSFHLCDVTDRAQVASFREEVLSKWGGVSLLINNAGVVSANNLSDSAWEELELVVNVNLWGVINCTKMFMPDLIDQKEAFCVNVSSLEGFLAIPGDVAYCTAKFAVRGFSEALMMENMLLCPHVRVLSVHPGFVQTNILSHNRERIRTDALAPENKALTFERIEGFFKAIGSTTPSSAATQILNGVRSNRSRVMVGTDAAILDWVVRLFPSLIYNKFVYFPVLGVVTLLVKTVGKKTLALLVLLLAARRYVRQQQ